MNSFSQADIAKRCNVTRATANRWVELAKENKNNLQLDLSNKIARILDNPHNDLELNRLASEAKKYRNSIPLKEIQVAEEFYKYFTEEEIVEIYSDIKFKKQIKHKYSYKKSEHWDSFYKLNLSPVSQAVREMISSFTHDVLYLLNDAKKINLIDIGPGNSYPVRGIVENLRKKSLLGSYVGVDISQNMLNLSTENLLEWYPDIEVKTYFRDVEVSRFGKIFLDNKVTFGKQEETEDLTNLILYLDGLNNLDDRIQVLKNLRSGMTDTDIILIGFTLDTRGNREQLNYIKDQESLVRDGWHLSLLGIDIENCETNVEYDITNNRKDKLYKMDKDYECEINILGSKKIIKFQADDKISTWRHYLVSVDQFLSEIKQSELKLVGLKTDKHCSYAIAMCKISVE